MSQFGMQMPGGRVRRSESANVYSALAFIAFVALAVACGFMWVEGAKIAKDGNPLTGLQQKGNIRLPATTPGR